MKQLNAREILLDIASTGVAAVRGDRCVADTLKSIEVPRQPVYLIAIGKAAVPMSYGALDAWGSVFEQGLIITKHGCARGNDPSCVFPCVEAGHPLPDRNSLLAGEQLLKILRTSANNAFFLFLISGGASALVEVPVDGLVLEQLQRANNWLISSGLPIEKVNAVRRRLSQIKGGGLAGWLNNRSALQLMLSDVADDDPAVIGSGLLVPPTKNESVTLPPWLQLLVSDQSKQLNTTRNITTKIIATNDDARQVMAQYASEQGLTVFDRGRRFGEVEQVADELFQEVIRGQPGCYIWGGETTIKLPPQPGSGGRNQHLALKLAQLTRGQNILWLCLGSDGNDGPGTAAGALVDGETLQRGEALGYDVDDFLQRADSGSYLAATGDLLHTGNTGTNVMDLVLALKSD